MAAGLGGNNPRCVRLLLYGKTPMTRSVGPDLSRYVHIRLTGGELGHLLYSSLALELSGVQPSMFTKATIEI